MLGRKVIYVRCINCSYNNVAKGFRLLDKKSNFCLYRKNFMQVRAFKRYKVKQSSGTEADHKMKILTCVPYNPIFIASICMAESNQKTEY